MRNLNLIVIHCSATREGVDYSVDTIRQWHKARGFRDVGYHFVIGIDGTVRKGRPIEQSGAHAKGYNSESVGVCYIGGLGTDNKPKDTRTNAQIHALRRIVETLKIIYDIEDVVGHRDLSVDMNGDGVITPNEYMKACPCFDVKSEL
jgi:N-acetyl-anhydromuramyl-L-alanine amidase AmpD